MGQSVTLTCKLSQQLKEVQKKQEAASTTSAFTPINASCSIATKSQEALELETSDPKEEELDPKYAKEENSNQDLLSKAQTLTDKQTVKKYIQEVGVSCSYSIAKVNAKYKNIATIDKAIACANAKLGHNCPLLQQVAKQIITFCNNVTRKPSTAKELNTQVYNAKLYYIKTACKNVVKELYKTSINVINYLPC